MADVSGRIRSGIYTVDILKKKNKRTLSLNIDEGTFREIHTKKGREKPLVLKEVNKARDLKLRLKVKDGTVTKEKEYNFFTRRDRELTYLALRALDAGPSVRGRRTRPISIFTGTWNMGNARGPEKLDEFIPKNAYDIYAIGVQECEYKAPGGVKCETHWFGQLDAHFGGGYYHVAALSLWGIRLAVYIRSELRDYLSDVMHDAEATGIGHVAGNKGAVAIAFSLSETSFLFVASHLAAHQSHVKERNSNYVEIIQGLLKLSSPELDVTNNFDHFFWLGDLNYRIDLDVEECRDLIEKSHWKKLYRHDQLRVAREKGDVFFGFEEGPLRFPPSYKYKPEVLPREYDPKKNRIPSWCDRVLWTSQPHCPIMQTSYNCCDTVVTSDHSPVYATFEVEMELPYIPISLNDQATAEIIITDLHGEDLASMDLNGLSDPFVVFECAWLERAKTTVQKETLTPRWPDKEVPKLRPFVSDKEFLRGQSIVVVCMDQDYLVKNDHIGQGFILLKDACGKEPAEFTCPLRHEGLKRGVLKGKIHVVWDMTRRGEVTATDRDEEREEEED